MLEEILKSVKSRPKAVLSGIIITITLLVYLGVPIPKPVMADDLDKKVGDIHAEIKNVNQNIQALDRNQAITALELVRFQLKMERESVMEWQKLEQEYIYRRKHVPQYVAKGKFEAEERVKELEVRLNNIEAYRLKLEKINRK